MIWLHYIGRTYDPEGFVREARRLGACRKIPLSHLKRVSWGDVVYCAKWAPLEDETGEPSPSRKTGKAYVFCSFKVERVVVEDVSEEVIEELKGQGKVIEETPSSGRLVRRGCGCYIEGRVVAVSASVEEIYVVAKKKGGRAAMICGPLLEVFDPPRLFYAPFTRGLLKVSEEHEVEENQGKIVEVKNHRIARSKKRRREVVRREATLSLL